MTNKINICLIDDHQLVRDGIRLIINQTNNMKIINEYENLNSFLDESKCNADIILLDLTLPDSQGIASIQAIKKKYKEIPILILTMHNESQFGVRAMQAGAKGYLTKDNAASELIYAITKYNQEQIVMLMGKTLNIPTISLRYQNVYGPGQSLSNPYTGILSVFSTRLLNHNDLEVYEDGGQSRDFVYIDDVVNATTLALEKKDNKSHILNVGSGKPTSVLSVAKQLIIHYDQNQKINISGKYRFGDIRHNYADIRKANTILGYKPKYNFKQGLLNFTNWVKTQKIETDNYIGSVNELKNKGLIK